MLPTSRSQADRRARRPAPSPEFPPPKGGPLAPIGPERLRALREAIRSGTYPTEEDVVGGLARLLAEDLPDGDDADG